jgi:glycosyltransferase involved in cell wall biosynthesis
VAAVTPGKGHLTLIESFAALPHRRWRLVCAGSLSRCPQETDRVRRTLAAHDLEAQVSLPGELGADELEDAYHHADVAVLATLRETFGMAVAEALARGLPVVATTTGAIPALVGRDAGLLVAPGDRASLTSALQRIIDDADLRARCAAGARRVRGRLPDWNDAAARLIAALPS